MNAEKFHELLIELEACDEAVAWCEGKSLQEAWETATNPDWMLWLSQKVANKATDREFRLIAVKCARQVQHLMLDERSVYPLGVAEKYANGEATKDELFAAIRVAAWAAACAAARAAAWDDARNKQCEIIREYIPILKIK